MAMDVDEDEDGTQRPKEILDYGIQVDFESIDEYNLEEPGEAAAKFDKEITEKTTEIERMAPNMKAMERSVIFYIRSIGPAWVYNRLFFVGLTTLR